MPNGVPRTAQPFEWIKTKVCGRCKKTKPWARFPPRKYWPDGSVRTVGSYCHSCESEVIGERQRHWRERTNDTRRAYQREWIRRKRAAIRGETLAHGHRLPREPLVGAISRWLVDHNVEELVDLSGVSEKGIGRILSGAHQNVRPDVADRLAVAIDVPLPYLYPDET